MALEGLLHLWNEWEIQILVLVSFALQVFLLVFAGMRRHSSSTLLRVALWLAYLLADSTAVYTMGHLSVSSRSREHQLVAFWAPFLLLHLGGQDTITAYALEDSRLWLRHLQVFFVQALGAAYVLYKYMAGNGISLLLASISMFVAGLVKYGERIWALKHGTIRGTFNNIITSNELCRRVLLTEDKSEEQILLQAHRQLFIFKNAFTEFFEPCPFGDPQDLETVIVVVGMDLYKLVEMELSLVYDILYTKASVIHTWYGLCIHFISLLGTATAFLLFQLRWRRDGYNRVDVIISYVLLVGALVLEAMSLIRALLSSQTRSLLCKWGWIWPFHVVTFLRQLVQPARRRLWRYSIGQYNLLHLCTRDLTGLKGIIEKKLLDRNYARLLPLPAGFANWWDKLHFSGTFSSTDSFSVEDLKKLVLQELLLVKLDDIVNFRSRGHTTLKRMGAYQDFAEWSVNIEFEESIHVWHMATELYIHNSEAQHDLKLIEATRVVSNYMMFLLMRKPDMLPGRMHLFHMGACVEAERLWRSLDTMDNPVTASPRCWNLCRIFKEFLHHEGPDHSSIPQRAKLAKAVCQAFEARKELTEDPRDKGFMGGAEDGAIFLARQLLDMDRPDTLKLIFGVWVEMMLYAAERCNRDSHVKQLSSGGEFITIVWLLAYHLKCIQDINNTIAEKSNPI
ncbi:hypothetical protein ACP70R_023972 [Stipagrostis hirtigluma subsp. patula]